MENQTELHNQQDMRDDSRELLRVRLHVGSHFNMQSTIASGLIAEGKIHGRDRQTVFFTAVDPMDKNWADKEEHNLTQLRHAAYRHLWKVSQDAENWVDICRAERMGLKFYQIRSNAIILHDMH